MFLSRRTLISSALLLLLPLVQYANATNSLPNSNVASVASSQLHTATDELTFANYQQVSIHHIALALNVDFAQQQLSGDAILELDSLLGALHGIFLLPSEEQMEPIQRQIQMEMDAAVKERVDTLWESLGIDFPAR